MSDFALFIFLAGVTMLVVLELTRRAMIILGLILGSMTGWRPRVS